MRGLKGFQIGKIEGGGFRNSKRSAELGNRSAIILVQKYKLRGGLASSYVRERGKIGGQNSASGKEGQVIFWRRRNEFALMTTGGKILIKSLPYTIADLWVRENKEKKYQRKDGRGEDVCLEKKWLGGKAPYLD